MSRGVLDYVGMQFDQRSNSQKPAFKKKDGSGIWMLDPGQVDFTKLPVGQLYIEWDNWIVQKATPNLPEGGGGKGGGFKPQPYHPEQFVSNVVGQAIASGKISDPRHLDAWAEAAAQAILAAQRILRGQVQGQPISQPQQAPARPTSTQMGQPVPPIEAYEEPNDDLPF